MAFGLGELRLAPRDFWAMTPREIAAAADVRGNSEVAPPSRGILDALIERFPDSAERSNDDDR